MSVERLKVEAGRWLAQARDDLEAAEALIGFGKQPQAAFLCQQAGDKALKGFWFLLDLDPWGHSLTRLIKELPQPVSEQLASLIPSALALDKLYIPTRYPDALAELTPGEAYTRPEAEDAAGHARRILDAVAARLAS